eukprot:TRINITY_DN53565_c0_g1_i1.p1 TRINITY_DN53565_c0_g1~~TRINITY_DN53565_c0_g1_i1.p1  ORF type:complete len:360 (+),score=57.63 TRINITY_DN53565_c0_g1_i1:108-1082(+)
MALPPPENGATAYENAAGGPPEELPRSNSSTTASMIGNRIAGGNLPPPEPPTDPDELLQRGYSQRQVNSIMVQRHQEEMLRPYVAWVGMFMCCTLCIIGPGLIGCFVWMAIEYGKARNQPERCDAWLIEWTTVMIVEFSYQVFMHRLVIVVFCGYNPQQRYRETGVVPPEPARVKYYRSTLVAFEGIWKIVGIVLAATSSTCEDVMPGLRAAILTWCSLGIFVVVFMLINVIGINQLLIYMARNGMLNSNEGAPKGTLEGLPTVGHAELGEEQCSVCLEDFDDTKEIRKMPCGHCFHTTCLKPWLSMNRNCPLCRKDVCEPAVV